MIPGSGGCSVTQGLCEVVEGMYVRFVGLARRRKDEGCFSFSLFVKIEFHFPWGTFFLFTFFFLLKASTDPP